MKRLSIWNIVRYIIGIVGMTALAWYYDAYGFMVGGIWLIAWTKGCELSILKKNKES